MEHDCGSCTDTDNGDEDKDKGKSVEEELNLFLGEASSSDASKVCYTPNILLLQYPLNLICVEGLNCA